MHPCSKIPAIFHLLNTFILLSYACKPKHTVQNTQVQDALSIIPMSKVLSIPIWVFPLSASYKFGTKYADWRRRFIIFILLSVNTFCKSYVMCIIMGCCTKRMEGYLADDTCIHYPPKIQTVSSSEAHLSSRASTIVEFHNSTILVH